MSPVYSTAFERDGHTLGYIRLVNFSQHAAADMRKAITRLQVRHRPLRLPPEADDTAASAVGGLKSEAQDHFDFPKIMCFCYGGLGCTRSESGVTTCLQPATSTEGLRCFVQGEGAEGYILDLRSNPGGLVRAGLDVARLWLDGEDVPVFNVRSQLPSRVISPSSERLLHFQTVEHALPMHEWALCLRALISSVRPHCFYAACVELSLKSRQCDASHTLDIGLPDCRRWPAARVRLPRWRASRR